MKSWEMQNIRTQVAEIKNMVDYSELREIKDQLRLLEQKINQSNNSKAHQTISPNQIILSDSKQEDLAAIKDEMLQLRMIMDTYDQDIRSLQIAQKATRVPRSPEQSMAQTRPQGAFNTLYNPFMASTGKVSNFERREQEFAATSNAFYGTDSRAKKKEKKKMIKVKSKKSKSAAKSGSSSSSSSSSSSD